MRHAHRLVFSVVLLLSGTPGFAAEPAPSPKSDGTVTLDSMVITGTRRLDRSAAESMVPIDIVGAETISSYVSSELPDVLTQTVPSFNVQRLTIGEGLAFVRPARLRGLSPDQTLVLVNGKRQHRSALISPSGYQAVDLGQIPGSALKRIEVLRDGASAQYGSDAIAGVINVMLKDRLGLDGFAQVAQYFGGDGFNRQAGLDFGTRLGRDGLFNLALERTEADRTSRSVQRADALAYIAAHPDRQAFVRSPVQRWGQPEREASRLMFNTSYALAPHLTAYAFGILGRGEGLDDFNWRNPDTNAAFRRSTYQNAPTSIFPTFALVDKFPGGFSPFFSTKDSDYSMFGGVKGDVGSELRWDVSASLGRSRIDYFLSNTVNASFGPESPTRFDAGGLRQRERNVNADAVYSPPGLALARPTTLAFGAEHRNEAFQIRQGDRYSWDVGKLADLAVGSNGFPGWSPIQVVDASRNSWAAYADLEAHPLAALSVEVAGRYEHFSDFGAKSTGKLASRWQVTREFAARAALSSGFHAPTPGLSNYTRTSQGLLPGTSTLFTSGQIGVTNPVAVFLGARALRPETSTNTSLGLVFTPAPAFTITLDAYRIDVRDRLNISQSFTLTAAQRSQLVASGVTDAANLNSVNFLTNAFDTRTAGLDGVATYRRKLSADSKFTLTGAANRTITRATRYDPRIVSNDGRTNLERRIPRNAGNLSAAYDFGPWGLLARVRYYGKWTDAQSNSTIVQEFSTQTLVDLSISYRFVKSTQLVLGVENVFNRYPDKARFNAANGLLYSRNSPYDADGGRWFARLNTSF
jgi:iron complex outermembrane receptor protein